MNPIDSTIDIGVALGRGVYSVGEDLVFGIQRTGEGLGLGRRGRVSQIGYENDAIARLLYDVAKYGVSGERSPLHRTVVFVLEEYYSHFPEEAVAHLARAMGLGTAYVTGRMIIGRSLAVAVATRITAAIAMSAAYKQLANRLGIAKGASATGVGIPIAAFMMQGVLQRSSHAAMRLNAQHPTIYTALRRNGDLQLLYFLLERPLERHLSAISHAKRDPEGFRRAVLQNYNLNLAHR
jgi:hypothetical protein